jgi:hypothetical protein
MRSFIVRGCVLVVQASAQPVSRRRMTGLETLVGVGIPERKEGFGAGFTVIVVGSPGILICSRASHCAESNHDLCPSGLKPQTLS